MFNQTELFYVIFVLHLQAVLCISHLQHIPIEVVSSHVLCNHLQPRRLSQSTGPEWDSEEGELVILSCDSGNYPSYFLLGF